MRIWKAISGAVAAAMNVFRKDADMNIVWNPTGNTHTPGPTTAENFPPVKAGDPPMVFNLHTPALGHKALIQLASGGGAECMHAITIDGYTWSKSHTPAAKVITGATVPGSPGMPPAWQGLKPDSDYPVIVTSEPSPEFPIKFHINCQNAK